MVRIDTGLPDKTGYEYDLFEPMKVHMAIAAEQLVIGMYESTDHNREAMGTLAMIPKKINPTLNYRMGEEGWGIHAVQGYSLFRVLVWITGVTVLGLVFVLFWLIFVNKTDLQNAFVPAAWLSTMTLMALAIPQALGVA